MNSHLPINLDQARSRNWDELDIILVSGDAYIDHPAFGVPLLARWLEAHGFRVGIIAQPDWRSKEPFMALGRPRLFFGVSAGAMDSMVAHYTPQKKLRHDDAYTPGNRHGARPNRATIIYTSRIREAYRDVPVIIGGIEASLRRLAHYDFWEDKVRRSVLLDSKADMLVFGMAEHPLLQIAQRLKQGETVAEIRDIRGTAYISSVIPEGAVELPCFDDVKSDRIQFAKAFTLAENEQNPYSSSQLAQRHTERWVVCNQPALPLSVVEMDKVYGLPYTREPHPSYRESIPAFEQIRLSVTTHRGCFGGCSFCSIASHQGKFIQSRSIISITNEAGKLAAKSYFKGHISDLGGPTANMYGLSCGAQDAGVSCRRPSCLFPAICSNLVCDDRAAVEMLGKVIASKYVKGAVISSGIRFDLLEKQPAYFSELLSKHLGGLLKVAPEHLSKEVTRMMKKPAPDTFERFLAEFRKESKRLGRSQAVVPYMMSGHPGSTIDSMVETAEVLLKLRLKVEQVQEFTPTPGTASTCMYYTGVDPATGKEIYVARSDRERRLQKSLLLWHLPDERARAVKRPCEKVGTDW